VEFLDTLQELGLLVDQELRSEFGGNTLPIKKYTPGPRRSIPLEDWVKVFGVCTPQRFFDPQEGERVDKYFNKTGAGGTDGYRNVQTEP
jgi:hypothetical protein